jgi:hypothetical protein
VRGTVFDLDTNSIKVIEGAVSFVPSSETARPVTVSAGQESWISADTGQTVAPAVAAESNIALPSLPGQSTAAGVESGGDALTGSSSSSTSSGSNRGSGKLTVDVNLTK